MSLRRARRSGRRAAAAMTLAGLAFIASGVAMWQAPSAGAVELFSFDLVGESNGYTFFNEDASGARQLEGTIPKSNTDLTTGPVGYGLASLAWPGPLAANAGTLILVLNPDAPPQTSEADYPVRAEARTGQDPPETRNEDYPGTVLKAKATAEEVTANARVENATGDPGTFGPTQTDSVSRLTAEGGFVEARSLVEDVDIGGVIKIESVRSVARATTDGTTSDGAAETVVTGLTIGGQPATVDENGVTFGEQGEPANAVANQIARQALDQSGFAMTLAAPEKESEGATTEVVAGSLLISQTSENGVSGIRLGGAVASVTGAPGFDTGDLGDLGDVGAGTIEPPPADPGSFDPGPVESGPVEDFSTPPVETPEPVAGDDEVAFQPAVDVAGRPVTVAAVITAMLGAGLFALGMRRLSDSVLAERAAVSACPLAGEGR